MIQVIFQTLLILIYFSFILLFLPVRAWKKGRKKLSITLSIFSFLSVALLVSYFTDDTIDDAGFVVFGMLFYMPAMFFIIQLVIYLLCKFFSYINKPRLIKGIDS
ncbi:hypothetical protein GCM10009114_22120 [Aliiglaciecola litoralis]|uniref:Group-specific protein n=1 Tax=Aliiglaciecola litoralis TaxID=582857 RepID=A0ABN1LLG4_9ALTE